MNASISKLAITLLLVVSMCEFGMCEEPKHNDPQPQMVEACGAPCIIGALVLAIGIGIAIALKRFCNKHLRPSPPPPPPPPTGNTNSPSSKMILSEQTPIPILQFEDDGVDMWDISNYGWNDGDGYRYLTLVNATLESSTNMNNWEIFMSLQAWCSMSNVLTVIYDSNGAAIVTNYTSTGTNGIPLSSVPSLGGQPAQARYFRLKTAIE